MAEEYVTKPELELEQPPARLLTWVNDKVEAVASQPNGKHAIRFGEGLLKQLMEEVRPVALFAAEHFGDRADVLVRPAIGNQSYDATIRSLTGEDLGFKFIEVTQAHEGENEHLRMFHLEEKGYVSLHGPVEKTGTKHTGICVTVQSAALDHSTILETEFQRIKDAAIRKSQKSYQEDTALLIQFEDFISFMRKEDIPKLDQFVRAKVIPLLPQFKLVALVGSNGNYVLKYWKK